MEPFSAGAGIFIGKAAGGAAIGKVTSAGLSKAVAAFKGPELDRVLEAVDDELGTGVGTAGLTFLREDPTLVLMIVAFLDDRTTWDEDAVAATIEPYVGPAEEGTSARDFALRIARAIERNAFKAQASDRTAIVREVQSVGHEVGRLAEQVAQPQALLSLDWVPAQALEPVRDLYELNAGEARALEESLSEDRTRMRVLTGLIGSPPVWIEEGTTHLWATLGELAQAWGLSDLAEQAALEACERPGADRPRLLARASNVAKIRGDSGRAQTLLDEARALDPDHPSVRLVEAQNIVDPKERLAHLAQVEPLDARQGAALESARALAELSLRRIAEAEEHVARALEYDPDSPGVRELRPLFTLFSNEMRIQEEGVDWRAVQEAGEQFLELREEMAGLGRHGEAALMRARAAEAFTLAGDRGRGAAVIEQITGDERGALDENSVRLLAQLAIEARRPDLAGGFLENAGGDEGIRLLRGQVMLLDGSQGAQAALPELDALLAAASEDVRVQAAQLRVVASLIVDDIGWSDDAEGILRAHDEVAADVFVAGRLAREGNIEGARATLVRHHDDPRALRALVDLAAEAEDWTAAIPLQTALVENAPTPGRRLDLAALLERGGREQEASQTLDVIRGEAAAPVDIRVEASARQAQRAWNRRNYSDLVAISTDWLKLKPDSPAAGWALVLGLVQLSRYAEALRELEQRTLEARDEQEAHVAALVFHRALPMPDALRRIVELSDRFDRSVEVLEALVILTGIGSRDQDVPPDLHERRAATFAEFTDRFPNSQFIKAIPAPETEEELEAFLREHFSPGAAQLVELNEQLRRGETAVAVLATFVGKHVPQVWARLGFLPLAFGDPALRDIERAAALDAIGKSAVWESSALFFAGGLGTGVEGAIHGALPGSVVSQCVLDDAAAGVEAPFDQQDDERLELGWDPVGDRPQIATVDAEQREIDRLAAEGVLRIAQRLRVVPDVDRDNPGRFDDFLVDENRQREVAFRTWVASFSVAERLGMPLYSDDRYVRAHAHGACIPTFGTPALLDALVERGLMEVCLRDEAIVRLRTSGAIGLAPDIDELVAEAARAEWDLDVLVGRALLDPTVWSDPGAAYRKHVAFLREAFRQRPDNFPLWVARVVEAARSALPDQRELTRPWLLAIAWLTQDGEFSRELLRVSRLIDPLAIRDPLVPAFAVLGALVNNAPPLVRIAAIKAAFQSVEFADRLKLFALLRFE